MIICIIVSESCAKFLIMFINFLYRHWSWNGSGVYQINMHRDSNCRSWVSCVCPFLYSSFKWWNSNVFTDAEP